MLHCLRAYAQQLVCASERTVDPNQRSSASLDAQAQCAVQSIAPLLRSNAPVGCHILSRLCSIAWYLRSSAYLQSAPTNPRQLSVNLLLLFFIFCLLLFIFICLFFIPVFYILFTVFNFY